MTHIYINSARPSSHIILCRFLSSTSFSLTLSLNQNAHNDHSTTPPTQWHDPLPGWVEQHHLHTITNPSHADRLPSSRTLPAIAPSSLTDGLGLGWARVREHVLNKEMCKNQDLSQTMYILFTELVWETHFFFPQCEFFKGMQLMSKLQCAQAHCSATTDEYHWWVVVCVLVKG